MASYFLGGFCYRHKRGVRTWLTGSLLWFFFLFFVQSQFTFIADVRVWVQGIVSQTSVSKQTRILLTSLFFCSEHCVLTWTERGIYIFIPQNVQVLLWSEIKGNCIFLPYVIFNLMLVKDLVIVGEFICSVKSREIEWGDISYKG